MGYSGYTDSYPKTKNSTKSNILYTSNNFNIHKTIFLNICSKILLANELGIIWTRTEKVGKQNKRWLLLATHWSAVPDW